MPRKPQLLYDNLEPLPRRSSTADLTGNKYDMVTVEEFAGYIGPSPVWWVRCDCGTRFQRRTSGLAHHRNTKTPSSCGCAQDYAISKYGKLLYRRWYGMDKRLLCPEWAESFAAFGAGVGEQTARYLVRPDRKRPMGPDNFEWRDNWCQTEADRAAKKAHIRRQEMGRQLRRCTQGQTTHQLQRNTT